MHAIKTRRVQCKSKILYYEQIKIITELLYQKITCLWNLSHNNHFPSQQNTSALPSHPYILSQTGHNVVLDMIQVSALGR